MKKTLLLSLMTIAFISHAQAKPFFGTVDKYIMKNNQIIEIGSNDIENGQGVYFDYRDHKRKNIDMSEVSKSTKEEIAGVKIGETILLTTGVANDKSGAIISRYCSVFSVFENGQAHVGCRTYKEDNANGQIATNRLDFIVGVGSSNVTAQVDELEGIRTGENRSIYNNKTLKDGRKVKVLAIFENGEVLVQRSVLNIQDTSSIIQKHGEVLRISISDLKEI